MYIMSTTILSIINNTDIDLINVDNINLILIIFPLIASLGLFMMPFSDLLNRSEEKPDWKIEQERRERDRQRDDELIRRLKLQANNEMFKRNHDQWDVYDHRYPLEARLTPELIEQLHNRPISLLFYELRPVLTQQKLFPLESNHTGYRHVSVKAIDYLNVTGVKWF